MLVVSSTNCGGVAGLQSRDWPPILLMPNKRCVAAISDDMTKVVIEAGLRLSFKFMSTLPQLEAPDADFQSGIFYRALPPAHNCETHETLLTKTMLKKKRG